MAAAPPWAHSSAVPAHTRGGERTLCRQVSKGFSKAAYGGRQSCGSGHHDVYAISYQPEPPAWWPFKIGSSMQAKIRIIYFFDIVLFLLLAACGNLILFFLLLGCAICSGVSKRRWVLSPIPAGVCNRHIAAMCRMGRGHSTKGIGLHLSRHSGLTQKQEHCHCQQRLSQAQLPDQLNIGYWPHNIGYLPSSIRRQLLLVEIPALHLHRRAKMMSRTISLVTP